jgi:hypothetical protein
MGSFFDIGGYFGGGSYGSQPHAARKNSSGKIKEERRYESKK